jgi:hypothetical protein
VAEGPGVIRRIVLPVLFIGLTALGLLNTYGDSTNVQKLASDTACGTPPCEVRMTEFSRSPLSHEYSFQVGKHGDMVQVTCARAFIFLGDYACKKK